MNIGPDVIVKSVFTGSYGSDIGPRQCVEDETIEDVDTELIARSVALSVLPNRALSPLIGAFGLWRATAIPSGVKVRPAIPA